MKRIMLLFTSGALLALLTVYLSTERDGGHRLQLGTDSYMEDVSITQNKDGELSWTLQAKRADFVSKEEVKLTDLKAHFPEKDLTLTSEFGTYDMEKRNFTIEGNIKATTKDYTITASLLTWDASRNELVSDGRVNITGSRFSIQGDSLKATPDHAELNRNVRAVFEGQWTGK